MFIIVGLLNKDKLNSYEINRIELADYIKSINLYKPSYGYRRINAVIKRHFGWIVSNNLIHKICKAIKIHSKVKHYKKYKAINKKEALIYPNIIKGNWKIKRPFEKIVSDTTMIKCKGKRYDWNIIRYI